MAYILLVLSIVVLGVPVVPHHHHDDDRLCMKNDISDHCCTPSSEIPGEEKEHCCCQTGCITTHFFQQRSDMDMGWLHPATHAIPDFLPAIPPLPLDLSVPTLWWRQHPSFYIESLHGTFIARATGLRAPPSLLH